MIIGLGYKARSGKDTAAAYMHEHYGFTVVAFADALKSACREIFGLSQAQLYGDQKEVEDTYWHDTPRNILQKVGTECLRRGYRQDVWIRALGRKILQSPSNNWVVTDVRFPNEADAVKSWGGKVVVVNRFPVSKRWSWFRSARDRHASEVAMDKYRGWDYALDNTSDLPAFYDKVKTMMQHLAAETPVVHPPEVAP